MRVNELKRKIDCKLIHFNLILFLFLYSCGDNHKTVDKIETISFSQIQKNLNDVKIQSNFFIVDNSFSPQNLIENNVSKKLDFKVSENPSDSISGSIKVTQRHIDENNNLIIKHLETNRTVYPDPTDIFINFFEVSNVSAPLLSNSMIEVIVFDSMHSSSNEYLPATRIYQKFTGSTFNPENSLEIDPSVAPHVIHINYYEICGQLYVYIFFNEALIDSPILWVNATSPQGDLIIENTPYTMWLANENRHDIYGAHIGSITNIANYEIKIDRELTTDFNGNHLYTHAPPPGGGVFSLMPIDFVSSNENQRVAECLD